MKVDRMREKADIELREELEALRKQVFDVRYRGGRDEVEQRGKSTQLRREMARISTILRERELGIRGQAPAKGAKE